MPQQQKIRAIGAALVPGAAEAQKSLHNTMKLPFVPVPTLESAINDGNDNNNKILRIEGSGPVQIVLFSTGVVVTSSADPGLHGHVISFPFLSEDSKIVDIAAGESHYVAVDNYGRVYTWGWSNEFGQLGRGKIFSPQQELLDGNVHEPVMLSQFGELTKEQAELSSSTKSGRIISTVIEKRVPHKIVSVSCGRHHTVLLSETKKCVFVFGRGHRGQLGLKDTVASADASSSTVVVDFVSTPRSVPSLFGLPISQICCSSSSHHTLVVLESGHLIAMGENSSGNLGVTAPSSAASNNSSTRASHSHCFSPAVVDISQQASMSADEIQEHAQDNNNSSVPSFPQLPRRMTPLIAVDRKTNQPLETPKVPVIFADSSNLHTVLVDRFGHLLTAGAPPLRLQNGEQPISALGALGRQVQTARDASSFGMVPEFFIDKSVGDDVICGKGFTAVLLRRHNAVFVSGAVQAMPNKSDVAVGSGIEASGWLHLDLGHDEGFTISQIFASGNGLLVVGSDEH